MKNDISDLQSHYISYILYIIMNQILLVNKPIGFSTFDLIRQYKHSEPYQKLKHKVGHAGTLDVFADGLVLLLLGEATKQFDQFQKLNKTYLASVRLGVASNTLDIEGELKTQTDSPVPTKDLILASLPQFIGSFDQTVPDFSAAKQGGQPLYKLARAGKKIIPKSKPVTVYEFKITAYKYPLVQLEIACSSGTYIRQLTYDLFRKMGIDSFLFSLRRTQIGDYHLRDAQILV